MILQKKGLAIKANPSIILVPEVGIEPTLPQGKGDFESLTEIRRFLTNFNDLHFRSLQSRLWEMLA